MRQMFMFFFLLFVVFVEVYSFLGVKQLIYSWPRAWKISINWLWWLPIIISVGSFLYLGSQRDKLERDHINYTFFFFCVGFAFVCFIPKIVFAFFHLFNDITNFVRWIVFKVKDPGTIEAASETFRITRFQFFNQLGLAAGAFTLGSMIYGITRGKYNYRVTSEKILFPDLPESFSGTRIVQISDLHLGSFGNHSFEEVREGIRLINELKPDYVFFTGDMVNFFASEAEPWIEIIGGIEARYGKFSILGNHDYSDYFDWHNDQEGKLQNMKRLKDIHREMNFDLLLNSNRNLEKDGQIISLIGVENWGNHGFAKYGNLKQAMSGVPDDAFKILLSHDPTHWEDEVMNRVNIPITFSGHTHGSQMGVEVPSLGVKLSLSPLVGYKRWGGLYREGAQYLNVNRGFGFLGFPGRVGMPPEITMVELHKG